jgi:diguanylate cyclase (GGDEF)-like protein
MVDLNPEHNRRKHMVERREPSSRPYRHALVVALIGVLLSLAGGCAVAQWEKLAAKAEFEGLAENQAIVMQNGVNEYVSRLMALRTLFESANEEITRSEYESFSGRLFEAHPGILRVAWLPRISRRERAEYEATAVADGVSGYRVRPFDGQPEAAQQDEYFPVYFSTEPKTSRVYGLDYASLPERWAVLERARDDDTVVVVRMRLFYNPTSDRTGVMVCVPVYAKGTSRTTVADRRRNLSGYVVSILNLPRLLQSVRSAARISPAISIGVYPPAVEAAQDEELPDFASDPQARTTLPSLDRAPHWSGVLMIGDSHWPMLATPAAGGQFMAHYYLALALLAAGLVLTALLAVYLGLASRSSLKLSLANQRVLELAQTDILTGLPNRAFFLDQLQAISDFEREHGGGFSILMLDLDRFKNVNDSLGHAAGDALLRQVGQRLKSAVRENDALARLGGDEFAIIQPACNDQRSDAIDLAMRIERLIAQPFQLPGNRVEIGTSIGIALSPEQGDDLEQLLKKADLALYRSKSAGRNCHTIYDEAMSAELEARNTLEADLRDAIARCEFEVHYQPFYDLQTGRRRGLEALVRWRHPVKGLIPPDQFIPLAEETGLIVALGEWVLRQACNDATSLPPELKVAVNLSPVQFKQAELFDVIRSALDNSGLAPERLEIEITESVLLERAAENRAFLEHLKRMGVSLALDDFGTGYSSLSYLTTFPFDKIKIDKSFISGMAERQRSGAIISSIVTLARGLDISVTAEGVETRDQLDRLKALGVNFAQGYLLGRPVPIGELEGQHRARRARQDAA